ncbi:hypothetical protein NDU88_001085 [Pleurodeles waltl]|uniref:Uncharacterized protein n=1 Tax=Pleurodeles waltl TaxID=8319 RepID=A0AAV7KNM2_PLEWA|nr:hypothetical protein NDU88_001085 [Pleurodeles waltl]
MILAFSANLARPAPVVSAFVVPVVRVSAFLFTPSGARRCQILLRCRWRLFENLGVIYVEACTTTTTLNDSDNDGKPHWVCQGDLLHAYYFSYLMEALIGYPICTPSTKEGLFGHTQKDRYQRAPWSPK